MRWPIEGEMRPVVKRKVKTICVVIVAGLFTPEPT